MEVMESYIRDGYAEMIPSHESSSSNISWFLSHFSVVNPKKPEKLRIVFDCGAEFQGTSLNQSLVQGPDLTNLLTGVLTRFREKKVALVSDIKSMFHQVEVNPQDKNALKFLWWSEGDFTKASPVYCMTVHLFGAKSSPTFAAFALRYASEMQSENFSQEAVQAVQRNFYVDDFLLSTETPEEGARIAEEVSRMFSAVGFTLTKWVSNESTSLQNIPESKFLKHRKTINCTSEEQERVLGIKWNVENDQFAVVFYTQQALYQKRFVIYAVINI